MTELTLQTPEVFKPLDQPSRYKGAGAKTSGDEAKRAFDAMLGMKKIDIAAIKAARQG